MSETNENRGNILVVDDNEMNRDMLSRRLQRKKYNVETAVGGREAIDAIKAGEYDLILLDITMPEVDGFEVLERVRRIYDATELPIIMATAKTDSEDVVKSLEMGANDYVTKPIDFQVALARVNTQMQLKESMDRVRTLEQSLAERNAELQSSNDYMLQSLESAARFQLSLLQKTPPSVDGLNIGWIYCPCDELAGDSYGVYELPDSQLLVYQLDVTGHGVKAALLAVTLIRLLNPANHGNVVIDAESGAVISPAKVISDLNDRFQINEESNQFFTMVYGIYDCGQHVFTYVNAAHSTPILIGANTDLVEEESDLPVGVMPQMDFTENRLELHAGQSIAVYSDGIIEAIREEDGELLGEERLVKLLKQESATEATEILTFLEQEVREWCGDAGLQDDVSALLLQRR
ncbi:MAG: SpoIIE family protein phosphatase [Planctomycetaceae bacterium]|nr:SpoIIE family protein phosphatase [Planctomycetaceae bacterium]MBT4014246.1 SpoIIE family protein phosphatase [Planctomycetaceae bacterium]MBT4723331.1 SpoIIE family protein phosphatase [Planctomycetaceae bacterium]MBT5598638.1 SpoIIE family protein phosphatase [Planctomycetaceae bacterium]MBT5883776.1 SpoIIE family protein phosphatase [Planctomycetaceae bacterium]